MPGARPQVMLHVLNKDDFPLVVYTESGRVGLTAQGIWYPASGWSRESHVPQFLLYFRTVGL